MAIDQTVADILDETIHALTHLDLDTLQILEKRISGLAAYGTSFRRNDIDLIQEKQRLLGVLLHNCERNLNILTRLHGRNTRDQWAH